MILKHCLFFMAASAAWGVIDITMFVNARTNEGQQNNGYRTEGRTKFTMFQHDAAVSSSTVNYHFNQRDALIDKTIGGAADSSDAEVKTLSSYNEGGGDEDDEDDLANGKDVLNQPSGNHLLVDIKHVDPQILNSEDRLAEALVDLIDETDVTLLSYHCHSRVPLGVSCIGVLLESHIAIHTWPHEGALVLDLFTCSAQPLIPILPIIKKLFAIPSNLDEETPDPKIVWSHKRRGFRQGFDPEYDPYGNPLDQDIGIDLLRRHELDMKEPLISEETVFQHVDIYEVIDPRVNSLASYERSLSNDGSYESLHPDMFKPDKALYLDGVHQSSLSGKVEYHEALVHPAMITHPNPKRVAIIGGGEGATLREVLVHNTVEEVKMVEIDGELVDMCKEYLPEFSDCSDLAGSDADSCFHDSRASVSFEDAFGWFMDNFGEVHSIKKEERFDVIIMDALDPEKMVEVAANLYQDNEFSDSLFNALTEEGIFVVQLGQGESRSSPAGDEGRAREKFHMMEALKHAGFKSMHIYNEAHAHYEAPWDILVLFKNLKSRASWYRSAAQIEIDLHRRLHRTRSGDPAVLYFDGPTMLGYQNPPRGEETAYCRNADTPQECEIVLDQKTSMFVNTPVNDLYIMPSTWHVINETLGKQTDGNNAKMTLVENELNSVAMFTEGYGHSSNLLGERHFTVGTNKNHCNNTPYNSDEDRLELTDLDHDPEATVYSPVVDRHLRQILAATSHCE